MRFLVRILVNGFGLVAAAYLLPGIHWSGGLGALLVAGFVLGAINLIVKPIVAVLSCPLIVLSLGLFYLVINGLMLALADLLLDALVVDGFVWAVIGGFFLAAFNLVVRLLFEKDREAPR
ncbi:MAG: phage holin family protein [Thermoanaerobaculia bacterium]|nr:phage holin family protein [Thermoanaerobaculia bacterium]